MTDDTVLSRTVLEEFGFAEDPEDVYFMRRRLVVEPPYPTYLVVPTDPTDPTNGNEVLFQIYDYDTEAPGTDTVIMASKRGCLRTVGQLKALLSFLGQEMECAQTNAPGE